MVGVVDVSFNSLYVEVLLQLTGDYLNLSIAVDNGTLGGHVNSHSFRTWSFKGVMVHMLNMEVT